MVTAARGGRAKWREYRRFAQAECPPRSRVLVVSEGATERTYLRELIDHLALNRALIDLRVGDPHHPEGVLRSAEECFETSDPDEYSKIFCVFDRDEHKSFLPTMQKIQARAGLLEIFQAIPSVPCFEYWLLLHFEKTTRPYSISADVSSCSEAERDLRGHVPEYDKGMLGARRWKPIISKLETARKNSVETLREAESGPGENYPYTRLHELVDYLESLKGDE